MNRGAAALVWATAALSLAGCTDARGGGSSGVDTSGFAATSSAPPPDLAKFLHPDYTVDSQVQAGLTPNHPASVVVTSSGPGLIPGAPVTGGTGDVQILKFDGQAHRWVMAFDAADQMTTPGSTASMGPLLDQSHPISDVRARTVQFAGRSVPALVLSGLDAGTNHPSNVAAIVDLSAGPAQIIWRSSDQGLAAPVITGPAAGQAVEVTAAYLPPGTPACCPVRPFRRIIGVKPNGKIDVVSDDRPYLGVWLAPNDTFTSAHGAAVVLGLDAGSPALSQLRPGDLLLGLDGAGAQPSTGQPVPQVEQIAQHHAGDTVALRVGRSGQVVVLSVHLGSWASEGASAPAPGLGHLGVQLDGSMKIAGGEENSPAQAAGLQVGDVVKSVNGVSVSTQTDLEVALWGTVGVQVPLIYVDSSGVSRTVHLAPGLPPQSMPAATIEHA